MTDYAVHIALLTLGGWAVVIAATVGGVVAPLTGAAAFAGVCLWHLAANSINMWMRLRGGN